MKSLVEHIEDINRKQTATDAKISEVQNQQAETDFQMAELISNQEYTACLIEMQTGI